MYWDQPSSSEVAKSQLINNLLTPLNQEKSLQCAQIYQISPPNVKS